MNVVSLENTGEIGFVRGTGAEPFDRRFLVAESFKEGVRKVLGVERLIRQLRNCFFYFNGVQLIFPLSFKWTTPDLMERKLLADMVRLCGDD